MARYPVKMLKDEQNQPFVPMVSAESIYTNDDKSFEEKFATKLEPTNLKGSDSITITKNGNDCTFEVDFGASDNIIDNLDTTVAGQGPLDARQGNVLKNMIPTIVDNLDSTDASKVLSANQGNVLKGMSVPTGGAAGQVLKKASDNDHSLEWGDAADPNAIVGDGSIMKIIELTYAEYKTLESNGQLKEDTEYHITDVENGTTSYVTTEQIQGQIENNVVNNLTTNDDTKSLSAAQGKVLNDKITTTNTNLSTVDVKRIPHMTEIVSTVGDLKLHDLVNGYNSNKFMSHTLRTKAGDGNNMSEFYGGIYIPNIEIYSVLLVELNCGGRTSGTSQFNGGIVLWKGTDGTEDPDYNPGWQNYVLHPSTTNYWKDCITKMIYVGSRTGAYCVGSVWNTYSGDDFVWNSGFGQGGSTLKVIGILK